MHVVIINGSPRVQKYSNTEKIIAAFAKGLSEAESNFETYAISDRKTWDIIRDAYMKTTRSSLRCHYMWNASLDFSWSFWRRSPKRTSALGFPFFCRAASRRGVSFGAARRFWKSCRNIFPFPCAY